MEYRAVVTPANAVRRRAPRFGLLVSLAMSALLYACGSGGSTKDGGGASAGSAGIGVGDSKPVKQADFATSFAEGVCDAVGPASSGYAYDLATCTSTATSQAIALLGTMNPATQVYNETAAGDCIAGLLALFRHCTLSSFGDPFPGRAHT